MYMLVEPTDVVKYTTNIQYNKSFYNVANFQYRVHCNHGIHIEFK